MVWAVTSSSSVSWRLGGAGPINDTLFANRPPARAHCLISVVGCEGVDDIARAKVCFELWVFGPVRVSSIFHRIQVI